MDDDEVKIDGEEGTITISLEEYAHLVSSSIINEAQKEPPKPDLYSEVTIPADEYERLTTDVVWLSCLESAGVDSWEGYSDAQEAFEMYIDEFCKVH